MALLSVEQPARQADGRPGADAQDHVAHLADRGPGEQALQVVLHQRHQHRHTIPTAPSSMRAALALPPVPKTATVRSSR